MASTHGTCFPSATKAKKVMDINKENLAINIINYKN